MTTALHTWLNQAQESTRFDSVAAKYGLVVDTPSGMSQTDQNALRFLRSLTEHSPMFFDSQAKLLSPSTPDLVPDLPASPLLATPMSMNASGPQRTTRRPSRTPRSPYALTHSDADSDALFAFDMPSDDPVFLPNSTPRRPGSSRARPYPACRAYTSPTGGHSEAASPGAGPPPLGYFPPAPEPSPALDMFSQGWGDNKAYPGAVPTPSPHHHYPNPAYTASPVSSFASVPSSYGFQSQFSPSHHHQQQSQQQHGFGHPTSPAHTEFDMQLGDDADRARMSALMYGSMRVRAVVAATETDGQGW